MSRRRSDRFLAALAVAAALGAAAIADARARRAADRPAAEERARLVARLGLTDPCLFNDARYTRHLSQADRFAPFQDHPRALEHFPSGSLTAGAR